jgi:hypothetical protein
VESIITKGKQGKQKQKRNMDKLQKHAPMVSLWLCGTPKEKRPSEEEEEKEKEEKQ